MAPQPQYIKRVLNELQRSINKAFPVNNTQIFSDADSTELLDKDPTHRGAQRIIRYLILLLPSAFVLYLLGDYLTSILIALIFYAALFPIINRKGNFLQNNRRLRSIVFVSLFTLACLLPILLTFYSVFVASKEIAVSFTSTDFSLSPDSILDHLISIIERNETLRKFAERIGVQFDDIMGGLRQSKHLIQERVLSMANSFLGSLPDTFLRILIVLALLYSLIAGSDDIGQILKRSRLFSTHEKRALFESFLATSAGTVVGTVLSGLTQATIIASTALFVGHGNPLLIGALTFLASFFPLIGTASVSITLIAHAVLVGNISWVIAFSISGALAGMADNIILPLVVGKRALVNPLFTLMCALGAIAHFGFFGIFIGPVVGAFAWTSLKLLFAKSTTEILQPID